MSMWCSARFKAAAALLIVAALAACAPADEEGAGAGRRSTAISQPEDLPVSDVSEEDPGVARRLWRAENETARSLTGNLSASLEEGRGGPLSLAFANGITLRAEEMTAYRADARVNSEGATFQSVLGLPPQVRVHVYRVVDETVSQSAAQGGLCGQAPTTAIAASEFVDDEKGWVLRIAAFRGAATPGETRAEAELCGGLAFIQP
ncbi:MAG: hypothetical protein AB7L65_04790 [Hyphomonadaceae bacterium]